MDVIGSGEGGSRGVDVIGGGRITGWACREPEALAGRYHAKKNGSYFAFCPSKRLYLKRFPMGAEGKMFLPLEKVFSIVLFATSFYLF